MARNLSMSFNWQGAMDYAQACTRVRLAEEAGVETVWVAEAWGRDCFTILTLLARETTRISSELALSIVIRAHQQRWPSISPRSMSSPAVA